MDPIRVLLRIVPLGDKTFLGFQPPTLQLRHTFRCTILGCCLSEFHTRGMVLFFHLYPTNHPLGNRESRNLNWTPNFAEKRGVSTTKILFFAWNRKDEHEMRPFLYLYHKKYIRG